MHPTPKLFGKRTAIYARFSSSNQREASIEDQVRVCTDFIEREGGGVQDELIFVDRAISGSSLNRAGFEQLMTLVLARPPRVDAIVCEDLSRVTRDLADGAALFKRLQFAGVPLIGIADNIDTANPGSKMSYGLKTLMSEAYIDDLRFRTKRGLDGCALKDYSTGGLPIGFRSEPVPGGDGTVVGHRILIDEQGKATITRIFTMYSEGQSFESIARLLNVDKVPPPRANTRHRRKGWGASTIRTILRNSAYVGEFTFNRREWRKVFEHGKILCRPQADGVYLAEGKFYPLALFSLRLGTEASKARDLLGSAGLQGPDRGPETPCSIVGCAGPMRTMEHAVSKAFSLRLVA